MVGDGSSGSGAKSGDNVDHTLGESGLLGQGADVQGAEGRLLS